MSHVEEEMHDISVLHQIIFTFCGQFACCAALRLSTQGDEIVILDDLGPYETALDIRMDDTGTLRRLIAGTECPCANLVTAGGEECTEIE